MGWARRGAPLHCRLPSARPSAVRALFVCVGLGAALLACEPAPAAPPADDGCKKLVASAQGGRKRLEELDRGAPSPEAGLGALADHCERIGKIMGEIERDLPEAKQGKQEVQDAAGGARMLAGLAARSFAVFAATLRDVEARSKVMGKLETDAGGADEVLGGEGGKSIGCSGAPCPELARRMDELAREGAGIGAGESVEAIRAHADGLDDMAQRIGALPASPAHQAARDTVIKAARDGAASYRALAGEVEGMLAITGRAAKERHDAEQAGARLSLELDAGLRLCGAAPPPPASAAPTTSAAPAP
ncbi:MAG: hypothetical protein WKG00_15810 [Polyangiaceae bacterium]